MGIGMRSVHWVEVLRLIPTKDHLDREKLDAVLRWFDPEDLSNLQPLKVASDEQLNLYLLDGHCRAWALWATGVELAPVIVNDNFLPQKEFFHSAAVSSLSIQ
ncbi:hypothetical protein H8S23_07870 [Anaerofilum sp. BX8]|uniref:ParB/Sulfiredoxin domain-containing protein n=1 Tax=Anaerofilum hominis TaxID=2763016 RepID=A0A923I9R6_9FIRM|nr:hypothetical protein [Anaerofilum hominis]MBC5581426.1 hypothetical protein [Anaerofilum hominis]